MRYFIDTEFNERPGLLDLISIALVAEDGREFYAISNEFDEGTCNAWVKANVLPKLPRRQVRVALDKSGAPFYTPLPPWMQRADIAEGIRALVGEDPKPEFWGYFADYDWVAFCWLFGAMVDLPKGWPMFCLDLEQQMYLNGLSKKDLPPQPSESEAHDALVDARWIRDAWMFIDKNMSGP